MSVRECLPSGEQISVSLRVANALLVVVGLLAVAGVLYLAGCFASKISASRTAAILKSGEPTYRRVVCRPSKDRGWDYTCVIDSSIAGRFTTVVKVNGSGIVDEGG